MRIATESLKNQFAFGVASIKAGNPSKRLVIDQSSSALLKMRHFGT
jgi:hypothetical protein